MKQLNWNIVVDPVSDHPITPFEQHVLALLLSQQNDSPSIRFWMFGIDHPRLILRLSGRPKRPDQVTAESVVYIWPRIALNISRIISARQLTELYAMNRQACRYFASGEESLYGDI